MATSPWAIAGASFANRASQGILAKQAQADAQKAQAAREEKSQRAAMSLEQQKMYREMQSDAYNKWMKVYELAGVDEPGIKPEENAVRMQNALATFKRTMPQYYKIIAPQIEQGVEAEPSEGQKSLDARAKNSGGGFRSFVGGIGGKMLSGASSAIPGPLVPAIKTVPSIMGLHGTARDIANEFSLKPNPMAPGREFNPGVMGPASERRMGIQPPPAMFQGMPGAQGAQDAGASLRMPLDMDPYRLPRKGSGKPVLRRR